MTTIARWMSPCMSALVLVCAGIADTGSARAEGVSVTADPARRGLGGSGGCGTYGTAARPYAPHSIWNTPIGSDATFQAESGAQTASLRHQAGVATWIGAGAIGIYQAGASDPVATWTYAGRAINKDWTLGGAVNNGTFRMRTPAALQFNTVDGWAIIVMEDGRHYLETWLGARTGATSYHARYIAGNSLTGEGIAGRPGTHEGIRAAGMSLLGGLIRTRDLDALSIDHAIAMAIATTQAGTPKTPYVWPATSADNFSGSYTGSIPLGSLFAIPKDVDLSRIGLTTAEGMALAKAFQTYGGYVTDTAGPSTLQMGYVEIGATQRQINNLHADLHAIRLRLTLVTNNKAAARGGTGATAAAPVSPNGDGNAVPPVTGATTPVGCSEPITPERVGE